MSKKQKLRKLAVSKTSKPTGGKMPNGWWMFFLLTMTVFVVYANSLNNAFVSDDIAGVLKNVNRTNLFASLSGNPFGFAYIIIRYFTSLIAGTNPLPYRLVNIIFHAGSANLIYLILLGLTGFGSALASALIFAVHPLLTEGVTWISAAPYSAGTFFGLLAFFFYLRGSSVKTDWRGWLAYICSLSFTQITITIAPILSVYEITRGTLRKNWRRLAVYYCLGLIFISVPVMRGVSSRVSVYEEIRNPAAGRADIFVQAPVAIANYVSLFLWPDKLTLYHSEMSFTVTQIIGFFVISLLVVTLAVWGWFRDRRISFWVMWFLLGTLVTLTPWGVTWIVAERYTYFGLIGLITASILIYERLIGKKIPKEISITILVFLLLALGTRTIVRNRDWRNLDTLALAAQFVSPSSEHNHNNLGEYYTKRREWDKAIKEFKKAIEINPRFAPAYNNLGNVYLYNNNLDEAEKNFMTAISISRGLWQSYAQLAVIESRRGDWSKAGNILKKGIKIHSNSELWRGLGVVYLHEGDKEKAIEAFRESLKLDPQNETAKESLDKIIK